MESTGELAWFRGEIWRSVVRPRDFARDLAREHYGLAGVLVAVVAGIGLSFGIDLLVLASKGIPASAFAGRLVIDALILGVRLAVTAAVVAWVSSYAVRLVGRRRVSSLDQIFTALTFALATLILAPVPGLVAAIAASDVTIAVGSAILLALVLRVIVGVALNLRALLPSVLAIAIFVVVSVITTFVLADEISRLRFLGYTVAPQLVPDYTTPAATGKRYEMLGFDLTLPDTWRIASTGVSGEAARFESSDATLVVARAYGAALDAADHYADTVAVSQKVGLQNTWQERSVVRINGMLVIDDRYGGTYEGRNVVWRQFTTVPGAQGLALVYRNVEPKDPAAALAEAGAIAATWRVNAQGR